MDADWSVELGRDDPALEFPWASPEGEQRYFDLQRHPELVAEIPEAVRFPELGEFLRVLNCSSSPWLSVKCDAWFDDELGDAEEIYHAKLKLGSYVDLIFRAGDARYSFKRHEEWVKTTALPLSDTDELPIACEFVVRRCWFHAKANVPREFADTPGSDGESPQPGFYVTFYLFGYGNDEGQARARWVEGLHRVTAVLTGTVR